MRTHQCGDPNRFSWGPTTTTKKKRKEQGEKEEEEEEEEEKKKKKKKKKPKLGKKYNQQRSAPHAKSSDDFISRKPGSLAWHEA